MWQGSIKEDEVLLLCSEPGRGDWFACVACGGRQAAEKWKAASDAKPAAKPEPKKKKNKKKADANPNRWRTPRWRGSVFVASFLKKPTFK